MAVSPLLQEDGSQTPLLVTPRNHESEGRGLKAGDACQQAQDPGQGRGEPPGQWARGQHDAPQQYWAGRSHHGRKFPPRLPWPPGRCQEGHGAHAAEPAPQAPLALVLALTVLSEGPPATRSRTGGGARGTGKPQPQPLPLCRPLASAGSLLADSWRPSCSVSRTPAHRGPAYPHPVGKSLASQPESQDLQPCGRGAGQWGPAQWLKGLQRGAEVAGRSD